MTVVSDDGWIPGRAGWLGWLAVRVSLMTSRRLAMTMKIT
jgi:hypothetical protein